MSRKLIIMAVIVIALFLPAGYVITVYMRDSSTGNEIVPQNTPEAAGYSREPEPTPKEEDPISKKIDEMTLYEKIGQMVLVGLDGYENGDASRQMIEKYHVGGFILYSQNIKDSNQLLDLINSLKASNLANKIPLFLSVDEEGGRITRMPDELVKIPAARKIGDINKEDFSFNIGSLIGKELKMFGFNMDFAPVLDINSNPQNPVIGDRSFGETADIVSRLGIQTMKGIQSQSVISVVKHFPGHGDTSVDSHKGLPVVKHGLKRLESFELIPFSDAIKDGADAVMVAHILLPEIDPEYPSSMSKVIINDVLRKNLGYGGVVLTDDMTMGAIAENYDIGNAAVKSINAGSDIILVCHDSEKELAVLNNIREAADAGIIPEEKIDESVYRILKLKYKYNLDDKASEPLNVKAINQEISETLKEHIK